MKPQTSGAPQPIRSVYLARGGSKTGGDFSSGQKWKHHAGRIPFVRLSFSLCMSLQIHMLSTHTHTHTHTHLTPVQCSEVCYSVKYLMNSGASYCVVGSNKAIRYTVLILELTQCNCVIRKR